MKLEKFNSLLGFSGNIAVLIGLVFLAIEIRDNTYAVRAQELGAVWEQLRGDYADSPEFVAAVDEALNTSPVLADDEWYKSLHERIKKTD